MKGYEDPDPDPDLVLALILLCLSAMVICIRRFIAFPFSAFMYIPPWFPRVLNCSLNVIKSFE